MGDMSGEYAGHRKNWDIFRFQELCTDPCNIGPCIIMLQREMMAADELPYNGVQDLVTISLCIQIAIDKMQLCSLSVAYACPYHNPTTPWGTLFTTLTSANRSPTRHHTRGLQLWGQLDILTNSQKTMLEAAYGSEINIQFSDNSSDGHSCSQHANCTLPQNKSFVWQICPF